jgi:hypothetical protein
MNKLAVPILTKSASSDEESVNLEERKPNTVTMAALQETGDIMSGKKKVKWYRLQPGISKTDAIEELKKNLGS